MKIKIKGLPKMKAGGFFYMPYAGAMSTNPLGMIESDTGNLNESYNDSVKPIDKDKANVEAEKGEVLFKFDAGGIFKVLGKRHSQGGTPLKADEGDFIFSNDKDLAITKQEAEVFDLKHSKSGKRLNTPAKVLSKEIDLKQYNKFLVMLNDPNADTITKTTAQIMLGKYMEKIGQIGYLQESKKAFPQGMPGFSQGTAPVHDDQVVHEREMSEQYKYGGWVLPKAQMGLYFANKFGTPKSSRSKPKGNSDWGLWEGDQLPDFQNRYGVSNAADKIHDLNYLAERLGYNGPKDNKSFQEWLYKSSPENQAIIDKWHNQYNVGPKAGMFDGKIGVRWTNAIQEMIHPRTTSIPTNPAGQFQYKPLNPSHTDIVQGSPKQGGPEYPFQGFNIGMNAQEVLSGIAPYLSALAQPTYYDMLTQKYSPNIRLDRLNNTDEVNNIQQQSSLAQREMFGNMPGNIAALASSDVRANEAGNLARSYAGVRNGNTQIANQESMINYQTDQQDNLFNLSNVHQTYNNNVLSRQRRNEQLTNGALGSMNNFMAIQNNLDTINQQATAAVLPFLSTVDSVDSNGNPIKVQVPPITFGKNRIPIPTGFGSFESIGVQQLANSPDSGDYKSAYEYFINKGVSPTEAAKAATIIFYGKNGQKGVQSTYDRTNPYAAMMSSLYKF